MADLPVERIPTADQEQFEGLLQQARAGASEALDQMMPLIYDRLQLLAKRQLRRLRPGRTLQTTALVNEAYLKLSGGRSQDWKDRNHFLCLAAVAMRQILVDHARRRLAHKRGGSADPVTLDDVRQEAAADDLEHGDAKAVNVLDLDRALETLRGVSPRLCELVELRYFTGLTVDEVAATLGLSKRTAQRDWRKARAVLHQSLSQQ